MAMLWPPFSRSSWFQPAILVVGTKLRALLWPLFAWSAWAQLATVVAGTTSEGAALSSVRLIGVGSAIRCGGGHDN
jgi:hypothetical protein